MNSAIESVPNCSVSEPSFIDPELEAKQGITKLQLTNKPSKGFENLTEVQKIAFNARPPTIPASREAPIKDGLKRHSPFQFGTRYLEDTDDVYAWNAWDHVDPSQDPDFIAYAEQQYVFQRENPASDFDKRRFNGQPEKCWDKFYGNNSVNFFKDRKWLRQEFPVLSACTSASDRVEIRSEQGSAEAVDGEKTLDPACEAAKEQAEDFRKHGTANTILEIGAGAGNTAFPLLRDNRNLELMIHAVDFSHKAIKLMQSSEHFDAAHMNAAVWDMASTLHTLPQGVSPGSVDVVVLIFAFSALAPGQWTQAIRNVWTALRPGGEVCFRDYGRGDLAQVRFRKGRFLGPNFYIRGDGTRVYFFDQEELRKTWSGHAPETAKEAEKSQGESKDGNDEGQENTETHGNRDGDNSPAFEILSLATDRRMLVNRQKKLKMYRCWMQGRFRKPA